MSQDAKRSVPGPLPVKPNSDDRKPSPAVTTSTGKRVIIKSADMFQDMQKEAVEIAIGAFETHSVEKDVAEHIKKEFDSRHGPTWHCIVGRNFGKSKPIDASIFLLYVYFLVYFCACTLLFVSNVCFGSCSVTRLVFICDS